MRLDEKRGNKIYDILEGCGADEQMRGSFLYHHINAEFPVSEWRFCGKFGFGGKYRSGTNTVDFYKEDTTPERIELAKTINEKLSKLIS